MRGDPSTTSSRFRGVATEDVYSAAPEEARDISRPSTVHWSQPAGSPDPFLQGAYWALSWSLETIFGQVLGDLLNAATVSNVERWNGSTWVPVA